jgi:hypothetical protein
MFFWGRGARFFIFEISEQLSSFCLGRFGRFPAFLGGGR